MNRIIGVIFSFLFFISCTHVYQPRSISDIVIKNFKMDSTSIRAIQAVDGERVFYAGSNGNVGCITDTGSLWNIMSIKY